MRKKSVKKQAPKKQAPKKQVPKKRGRKPKIRVHDLSTQAGRKDYVKAGEQLTKALIERLQNKNKSTKTKKSTNSKNNLKNIIMEIQKRTKEQTLALIKNGLSSIYSKEDVINAINMIDCEQNSEKTSGGIDWESIKDLIDDTKNKIVNKIEDEVGCMEGSQVCDLSSAEFSLNGNEIELDNVSVDTGEIENICTTALDKYFDNFEEELKEKLNIKEQE